MYWYTIIFLYHVLFSYNDLIIAKPCSPSAPKLPQVPVAPISNLVPLEPTVKFKFRILEVSFLSVQTIKPPEPPAPRRTLTLHPALPVVLGS